MKKIAADRNYRMLKKANEAPLPTPASGDLPSHLQALSDDIIANREDIEEIFNVLRRAGVIDPVPNL